MADEYSNLNEQQPQQVYQQPQQGYQQPQQGYQQPQQGYQQPQQGYQQPQQVYQQPQQGYQQPPMGGYPQQPAKSATALIVLSVLELLFCGGLFAIIPLVFSVQANTAYKMGDNVAGDAKAKSAKIALIVILAVGIVAIIALFAMGGLSALYN